MTYITTTHCCLLPLGVVDDNKQLHYPLSSFLCCTTPKDEKNKKKMKILKTKFCVFFCFKIIFGLFQDGSLEKTCMKCAKGAKYN